jgi:hypothetical protein
MVLKALALAMMMLAPAPAAQAGPCPEPGRDGSTIRASRPKLAAGHEVQVIAGGEIVLASCADSPGGGRVPRAPQVTIILAGDPGRLGLGTESDCDTTLLVADPAGGWHFDDDGAGGHDAFLSIDGAGPGRYDVWIGLWQAGSCRARLTLATGSGDERREADLMGASADLVAR